MKSLLTCLIALFTLTLPAAAQSVPTFTGDSHSTAWPAGSNAPGAFGRAVAGQITPDGRLDLVQLDGSELTLLTNPDVVFASSLMATGVEDLDLLPGAGLGGLDAVVSVGAAGLERHWYDPVTGDFDSALIDAGTWAGAELVRVADLNEDGVADLIGVGSDSQTVLIQLADATGTSFTPATGFTAASDVLDLLVLQWDVDSAAEVALLTDLAVDVLEVDGTLVDTFTGATPGGAFCKIGQAGTGQERLVWITEYAPPALQFLIVLSPGQSSDLVNLGALDAFAVVPTDFDLDGDDDILISHKFSYDLLWIENERTPSNPNGPSFQAAGDTQVFQVEDPGPAPENAAWPVVADFDGDGDDDVAFASDGSLKLSVFRGEAVDQDAQRVSIENGEYLLDAQGTGSLEVELEAPVSTPAGATHIEVRTWRQAALGAPWDLNAIDTQSIALPSSWPLPISIPLPETDADFVDNYNLQVRLVELDASGDVVHVFPATVGSFVLLATDRLLRVLDEGTGDEIEVPIPPPLDSEQDPSIIRSRRANVPPQPPSSGAKNIPKL